MFTRSKSDLGLTNGAGEDSGGFYPVFPVNNAFGNAIVTSMPVTSMSVNVVGSNVPVTQTHGSVVGSNVPVTQTYDPVFDNTVIVNRQATPQGRFVGEPVMSSPVSSVTVPMISDPKPEDAFMASKAMELREREIELRMKELDLESMRLEFQKASLGQAQLGCQNHSSGFHHVSATNQGEHLSMSGISLPKIEIQPFTGSALDYWGFKRAFEVNIASIVPDYGRLSSYLQHYCQGPARAAIKACNLLEPKTAYLEAWRILEANFGRSHHVVQAMLRNLMGGRNVTDDLSSMRALAQVMRECFITMSQMGKLEYLDSTPNMLLLTGKFFRDLQVRWADRAGRIIEQGRDPVFKDLLEFIERRVFAMDNVFSLSAQQVSIATSSKPPPHVYPQFKRPIYHPRVATVIPNNMPVCAWCGNKNHGLGGCKGFIDASLSDRRDFVRENRRCFMCLGSRHFAPDCKSSVRCKIGQCGGRHHSLLHSAPPRPAVTVSNANITTGGVSLGFVPVVLNGPEGEITTNALLDTGSEVTLISKKLAKALHLDGDRCVLNIRMVNGTHTASSERVSFNLTSIDREFNVLVDHAFTVDKLPCKKVDQPTSLGAWSHLKDVVLEPISHDEVGILIGYDVSEAHWVLDQRMGGHNEPHAVKTPFGWSVRGRTKNSVNEGKVFYASVGCASVEESFERLYEREYKWADDEDTDAPSREDAQALAIVEQTTKIVDGRFEVGVPWKRTPPQLPDNRTMAVQRVSLLKKRLSKDEELSKAYRETLSTYVRKGYVSLVTKGGVDRRWFLPHHPVVNPKKPGKIRIVFDCAAKFRNVSLNDELLNGPNLNNDLSGVLLRFREGPVAMSADIEEMFLRVRLPEMDRWAFSFLWWTTDDLTGEPCVFEWNVHPFGATSSPFCAAYALRRAARDHESTELEPSRKALEDNFYVDDCLLASKTKEAATLVAGQLTDVLSKKGFRLTKWVSNQPQVLDQLPLSERLPQLECVELADKKSQGTLGLLWDLRRDTLRVDFHICPKPMTKRGVLASIASFFDPLGIIGPLLLPGRRFFQKLCHQDIGWDSELEEVDQKWWKNWLQDLMDTEGIIIPRFPLEYPSTSGTYELHLFCDASEKGYGVAAYARLADENGKTECHLLMGKSRVVPRKTVTIPRLELTAAVLSVKLGSFIKRESRWVFGATFHWTDSMIVLHYLRNTTSRFKTFVANRVGYILEHSSGDHWRHVPTASNPADLASRGISKMKPNEMELWLKGPKFLAKNMDGWPLCNLEQQQDLVGDIEVKQVTAIECSTLENPILSKLLLRYSTWSRLVRGTAWLKRFVQYLEVMYSKRPRDSLRVGELSLNEIKDSERKIIQLVQRERFGPGNDLSAASTNSHANHTLTNLKPTLRDGLICVNGRVSSGLVVLPYRHQAVDLLIRYHHVICGHMGASHVLADIRRKFWIIKGMASVRRILSKCMVCKTATAQPCGQEMATLPSARVEIGSHPFLISGVDYFGPFEVKYGRSTLKRYGCLFTCMKTRAVHLEIAHTLSTDSFIMALIRFIGRRGVPEELYSDNGSNFVGAEAELRRQIDGLDHKRIGRAALAKGINWHFNPPNASHRGGVWERMIRTTRRVLGAVAGHQRLTDESLVTFMVEAERIINDRPLTPVLDDPNNPTVLRPNDLLLLRPNPGVPCTEVTLVERYTKAWRQAQYLASVFWKRWIREYLPTLQMRNKWKGVSREIGVGDLVLIISSTTPYGSWPKGVISEAPQGHDGHVRDVKIRTPNGEVLRDIRSVCLLEAAFE